MDSFVVAVDVGTSSARAGVFDPAGRLQGRAEHPIRLRREDADFAVHDSGDIWQAVARAVRGAVAVSGVPAAAVAAIGFDATCSLVLLDRDGHGLAVARDAAPGWDTIAWMDHRAGREAQEITDTAAPELAHVGGVMPPEMQLPKLRWLKAERPDLWERTGHVFDLADFLTFRATGAPRPALSTLTTKWSYLAHRPEGWSTGFLERIGLADLGDRVGHSGPPGRPGESAGGLAATAAADLGLPAGIPVAFGMVDAFAGGLALLAGAYDDPQAAALIGGTSSCVMRLSPEAGFIPSFWGPFHSAMLPDRWVTEGGQSATGALLDHVIRIHGGGIPATAEGHQRIIARIADLQAAEGPDFAGGLHILPDFHGNRSPLADPLASGVVFGLRLDASFDALCRVYYRAMVAIALGVRQILELMEQHGAPIRCLHLGGGHVRNPLMAQLYADITGREVAVGAGEAAMLLGTAMLAASAGGWGPSLRAVGDTMARPRHVLTPDPALSARAAADYRVFLRLQEMRREISGR